MAVKDSRRLSLCLVYLYPNLISDKDYRLYNRNDGKGTQLEWISKDISKPTDKELFDAKKPALIENWWEIFRALRNKLLKESDEYALPDRPHNEEWLSYRKKLRDLPTVIKEPSFEVLDNELTETTVNNIRNLMPNKPS